MNDFTASNGITIFVRDGGTVQFQHGTREESCGILQVMPQSEWWQTLREFFQAEADERLGRWRWTEDPDYVVYPRNDYVSVLCETRCEGGVLYRRDDPVLESEGAAARAYFDAHPEPKAWHAAAEGEVWELEFKAGAHAWFVNGDYFQSTKTLTNIYKTDPDILSAHRIYPPAD